jgi:hypothetical protein
MAGYFRKLNGTVYDGANVAAEELTNGVFAEITATGVKKTAAAKDTVLRVTEKTALWGAEAVVLDVVSVGEDEVFFVENEWDVKKGGEYDTAEYVLKKDKLVRMRRPVVGDQVIMTLEPTLYAALTEADKVTPAANGAVAKVAVSP